MIVAEFRALLNKLTEAELGQLKMDLYMKLDSTPTWDTGAKKSQNIDNFVWWAKGRPDRVQATVELANKKIDEKKALPVRGPVPNTHYLKWEYFKTLPSYPQVEEAVSLGWSTLRKCSPVTKDGFVSVDAIYNMDHWIGWKVNSQSSYERGMAQSMDEQLGLHTLKRLNQGRRMDQPALFPDQGAILK
jgi:hypothetical protein